MDFLLVDAIEGAAGFVGCGGVGGNADPVCKVLGGTVLFENKVRIFNKDYGSSTPNIDMSKALTFGDGTPGNDVHIKVLREA